MAEQTNEIVILSGIPAWWGRATAVAVGLRHAPLVPLIIIVLLAVSAIFASQVAPYKPLKIDMANALKPPFYQEGGSVGHFLGTDRLGRDVLSRIIHGSRVSLMLSMSVIALGGTAGILLGLLSGFAGGGIDAAVQRGVEAILALPTIMVALVFVSVFGTSFSSVVFILSPFLGARFARMVRGEALSVKERDYVAMARVVGASPLRIAFKHILPSLFNTIIVLATLEVGHLILLESSLSFLGVGVPPPTPAWGLMVSDGRDYIATKYWLALFPGLAILITILSLNLFGDWLRDTLDPKRRQL